MWVLRGGWAESIQRYMRTTARFCDPGEWCRGFGFRLVIRQQKKGRPDASIERGVLRGGAFYYFARHARCAYRGDFNPDSRNNHLGFRLTSLQVTKKGGKRGTG